ncbi:MAG: rRNA maturation RNase YbeY [Dehalococcoidia bacterium]
MVQISLNCALDIQVNKPFRGQVREEWIRHVAETVLASEEIGYPVQLSMVITDDETVRQLNHTYRELDESTDVLAFAFQEEFDEVPFPQSSDGISQLGEVIISCPQAAKQAEEQGHSLEKEIATLVIHGVLHLLGYDHEHPEEEREMRTREAEILTQAMEKRKQ